MNKFIFSMFVFGLMALTSVVVKAESKLGFVDVPKAVQATSVGKKAKSELESQFKAKKKEFDKKESDLKKMGQDLEKKKSVLSEEAFKAKEMELQREMMKFQDEVARSQSEIQKKQQELTAPILAKMQKVIAKVSKAKGFTLVLQNTQSVLFASPELDFTQEVIKDFEKEK